MAEGWHQIALGEDFSKAIGTIVARGDGATLEVAFDAEQRHTNSHLGTVHGGVLMTFVDTAFGYTVARLLGEPRCTTASLQLQFVGAGRVGDRIVLRPEVVRQTRTLVFLRGLVMAGERMVASADGIWKIFEHRQERK